MLAALAPIHTITNSENVFVLPKGHNEGNSLALLPEIVWGLVSCMMFNCVVETQQLVTKTFFVSAFFKERNTKNFNEARTVLDSRHIGTCIFDRSDTTLNDIFSSQSSLIKRRNTSQPRNRKYLLNFSCSVLFGLKLLPQKKSCEEQRNPIHKTGAKKKHKFFCSFTVPSSRVGKFATENQN